MPFSEVFNFCTQQTQYEMNQGGYTRVPQLGQQPGNQPDHSNFIGGDLYDNLRTFIEAHVQEVAKVRALIDLFILSIFRSWMIFTEKICSVTILLSGLVSNSRRMWPTASSDISIVTGSSVKSTKESQMSTKSTTLALFILYLAFNFSWLFLFGTTTSLIRYMQILLRHCSISFIGKEKARRSRPICWAVSFLLIWSWVPMRSMVPWFETVSQWEYSGFST